MFFFWIDGHDMRIIEVDGVCFSYFLLCFVLVALVLADKRFVVVVVVILNLGLTDGR